MIRLVGIVAALTVLLAGTGLAADAPVSHDIKVRLDPGSQRLEVTDILTVRGRAALTFRLASWIEIDELRLDGQSATAEPVAGGWAVALPDRGEHRLELRLAGLVPAIPPGGGRGATPSAMADTEGSYLSGYAGWIPITGDDWTAYRLAVEVPAPNRAVATGRLEEETLGESVNRAVFAAEYPAEPPALFAGPYIVQERREWGIRLRTWFHRDLEELSPGYLEDAARYLGRYSEEIGPYPFPDFHIISSPLPVGLGFPNLTYVGRMVLPLPFMRGRSLAHEALHNWWGNGVAPDYTAGNWAEGLTTYMADYALAAEESADKALEMRMDWLRNYAALPAKRDMPVTAFTSRRHDAAQVVGYGKVAFIFHMLRGEIGEAAFAHGLRLFWKRHRFSVADWSDIREAFEEAAASDLAWFFEQWLERAGAPRLSLVEAGRYKKSGRYRVTLTIRQDSPVYRLSVPVTIDTEAGQEHRLIQLDIGEKAATLNFASRPSAVHVDPEYDLLRQLLPGEAPPILRDVTLAADAIMVVAADSADAEQSARQVAERLLDVPVWIEISDPQELAAAPLLIVGTTPRVEAFLAQAGLPGIPTSLTGQGTARVWAARWDRGNPMIVVAADNVEAMQALKRPLPHYGGKSYLVFDGRRVLTRGIWPASNNPLSRVLVQQSD